MYDLLNTQACLSRQKEHLQLPERHLLHPGAWLFRVLCVKKYWALLSLTETLGSWGGSELAEDVQSVAEDAQHLPGLGAVNQTLGWCHPLPGNLKKNDVTFPMLSRSSFNTLLRPWCCLAVCCRGKTEPDEKSPMSPSVLRAPAAVSSGQCCAVICSLLPPSPSPSAWSVTSCSWAAPRPVSVSVLCTNMPAPYQEGGLVTDHPGVGCFPPKTWQRKATDIWAVTAKVLFLYTAA